MCPEGPLHGIPYGLKDIIAVPKYKTTWGSKSFRDQVINEEAWVYKRCILWKTDLTLFRGHLKDSKPPWIARVQYSYLRYLC